MNISEGKALTWLKNKGYKNIIVLNKTFRTDSGSFVVRYGYTNKLGDCLILLSLVERQQFQKEGISVLVYVDANDPFDIIKPAELNLTKVRKVVFHDTEAGKKITIQTRVSEGLYKDIQRLVNKGEYDSIGSFLRVAAMRLIEKHDAPILT